jgi:hypothetical protein
MRRVPFMDNTLTCVYSIRSPEPEALVRGLRSLVSRRRAVASEHLRAAPLAIANGERGRCVSHAAGPGLPARVGRGDIPRP